MSAEIKRITLEEKANIRYCVETWLRDEHVRVNTANVKGRIAAAQTINPEPMALVNFGPSLQQTWEQIKPFKFIMTCSGAHKFLVERGIIPTHHIDVDPRPHKVQLLGTPQRGTEYLIASTCSPDLFALLQGFNLKLWHIFDNDEHGVRVLPHGEWAITGGCSVGVRTLTLARFLGFTNLHVFGMDGSFGEQTHADKHPNSPQKYYLLDYDGKEYRTTPSMLEAVKNTWHELDMMSDVNATFYGEGLVQAMAKKYQRKTINKPVFIGFNKPELISAEYRDLNRRLHTDNLAYGVGAGRHAGTVLKLAETLSKSVKFVSVLDYGCQPLTAKVLTPVGWKTMGEINIGDSVIGSSGFPIKVISTHYPGRVKVFRVSFQDGTSLVVDGDHRWATRTSNNQKRHQPFIVKKTLDFIGDLKWPNAAPFKWRIPMVKPIEFSHPGERPIAPYLLGLLLGDGNLSQGCIKLSTVRTDIAEEATACLPSNLRLTPDKAHSPTKCYRITRKTRQGVNQITDGIRSFGLWGLRAWEKFIPPSYLFGPASVRLALLQGLIDTDGEVRPKHLSYSSTSSRLATEVSFLVQSLGGIARVVTRKRSRFPYKGVMKTGRESYVVHIKVPHGIVPTRVKKWTHRQEYHPNRIISSIKEEGMSEVKGISVDAADQLYVTEHCLVTHNCGKGYMGKALPFPIAEYDPAIPGKEASPRPADLVCCLDVLEHIEPERLDFVLDDLRRCTRHLAFLVIHTGPSNKFLADGRNAHLIIEGEDWWRKRLERFFSIPKGGLTYKAPLLFAVLAPKKLKPKHEKQKTENLCRV